MLRQFSEGGWWHAQPSNAHESKQSSLIAERRIRELSSRQAAVQSPPQAREAGR